MNSTQNFTQWQKPAWQLTCRHVHKLTIDELNLFLGHAYYIRSKFHGNPPFSFCKSKTLNFKQLVGMCAASLFYNQLINSLLCCATNNDLLLIVRSFDFHNHSILPFRWRGEKEEETKAPSIWGNPPRFPFYL